MGEELKVEDSILLSIKKNLGLAPDMDNFDVDLIITINSALNILTQLGVGPNEGFSISSSENTWDEFISDEKRLNLVKTYVQLKTKVIFDPPSIGSVSNSYAELIKELEWRINAQADPGDNFDQEVTENVLQ